MPILLNNVFVVLLLEHVGLVSVPLILLKFKVVLMHSFHGPGVVIAQLGVRLAQLVNLQVTAP